MGENEKAVDEVIANLDRIPKEIKSKVVMKDIEKHIDEYLRTELRRRVSY